MRWNKEWGRVFLAATLNVNFKSTLTTPPGALTAGTTTTTTLSLSHSLPLHQHLHTSTTTFSVASLVSPFCHPHHHHFPCLHNSISAHHISNLSRSCLWLLSSYPLYHKQFHRYQHQPGTRFCAANTFNSLPLPLPTSANPLSATINRDYHLHTLCLPASLLPPFTDSLRRNLCQISPIKMHLLPSTIAACLPPA